MRGDDWLSGTLFYFCKSVSANQSTVFFSPNLAIFQSSLRSACRWRFIYLQVEEFGDEIKDILIQNQNIFLSYFLGRFYNLITNPL
jgi:hypothetical protein